MMPRKRAQKRRERLPGLGVYQEFHGSFTDKAKAAARARARGGYMVARYIPGLGRRYVVMTPRVSPF